MTNLSDGSNQPLSVSPKKAMFLLDVGHTRLYELMGTGELESYWEGRHRKITLRSIHARVEKLVGHKAAA
jgi:hypothetical protein